MAKMTAPANVSQAAGWACHARSGSALAHATRRARRVRWSSAVLVVDLGLVVGPGLVDLGVGADVRLVVDGRVHLDGVDAVGGEVDAVRLAVDRPVSVHGVVGDPPRAVDLPLHGVAGYRSATGAGGQPAVRTGGRCGRSRPARR